MSLSTSNESSSKADQIAHKFFNKFALLLHNARATPHLPQPRVDKWFNLETPDTDQFRDHLRLYRTLSSSVPSLPPFELQVLLSVPELATNQVLVLSDASATRTRVDPTPSHVLLESWVVIFSPGRPYDDDRQDVALSSVYKQSISVFRSMFTLLRVLPAWKLFRKLRRPEASHLAIQVRVADPTNEDRILKFGTPLSSSVSSLPTSSHAFPPVAHPLGTLTISTTFLLSPLFHIDTLESLLSSRFLSQDDESFTPTLAARQQTSVSGSPMRASLPRSPPGPSLADRFVLPANPSAQLRGPPPATLSRAASGTGSRQSGGSGASGSRPVSLLSGVSVLPSGPDSPTGSGSPKSGLQALPEAAATAPSPGPLPIRRPSINAIHPFKSATLSSGGSPSLHSHSGPSSSMRHSPLSGSAGGPSLPSRPPVSSSPSPRAPLSSSPSTRIPLSSSPSTRAPLSPTYPPPPSPMSMRPPSTRPSPPTDRPLTGKRFSSSFGHRYTTSGGAGSDGSPGKRSDERERAESASFLSTTTDDDDISAFVQAIDARAPLSVKRGVAREESEHTETGGREFKEEEVETEGRMKLGADVPSLGGTDAPRIGGELDAPRIGGRQDSLRFRNEREVPCIGNEPSTEGKAGDSEVAREDSDPSVAQEGDETGSPQPRKYRDHVDAELKRMNDAFVLSLAGLEGRPRRRTGTGRTAVIETGMRSSSSSGSASGSPRAARPASLSHSPRSPASALSPRGQPPNSPGGAERRLQIDSPVSTGRSLLPDSPTSAGHTRLPDSPARGSPLRPPLTLFGSGSGSPSASASGSGPAAGVGLNAAHRRTVSTASGSDEIMGRLEFDDSSRPGSAGGRSAGYARPYPYR